MQTMQFADEWLVPTVEPLVKEADIAALRDLKVDEPLSLWETLVQRKLLTNEQILSAVARRFHLAIADLSQLDHAVREEVPESLVRKFNILPIRCTDSILEIATANPFDMDAEKMLAFATGREVRMLICAPNRIREKLDELYQKEDVVSKLLEGMSDNVDRHRAREDDEELRLGRRGCAASDHPAGGHHARRRHREPRERHSRRARRGRRRGPLPDRRRAAPGHEDPARRRASRWCRASRSCRGMDIADRLRPQDGRAPRRGQRQSGRPPGLDAAGVAGREGRHPDPEHPRDGPVARVARLR